MAEDFGTRAQLAHLHVQRLNSEAHSCTDLERLRAIREEVEVVLESMRRIREEQLIASLPKPRRTWRQRLSALGRSQAT
jgi:hypothetical protein